MSKIHFYIFAEMANCSDMHLLVLNFNKFVKMILHLKTEQYKLILTVKKKFYTIILQLWIVISKYPYYK